MVPVRRSPPARGVLLVMAAAALVAVSLGGCGNPPAAQIIDRMNASYEQLNDYQGVLDLKYTLGGNGNDQVVEIKQSFKKPDRHRLEFLAPAELKGQLTVFDGQTMWNYNPQDNEVTVFEQAAGDTVGQDQKTLISGVIDLIKTAKAVGVAGRGHVEGRSAYILELTSVAAEGDDPVSSQKIWIDRQTWLPLKVEAYNSAGKAVSSAVYKQVKVNAGLGDDLFRFTVPQGAKVTQGGAMLEVISLDQARKAASFSLVLPAYLPSGTSLLQVSRVGSGTDLTIVLDYGRDESTLTISENKVLPGAVPMPGIKPMNLGGLSVEVIQSDEFSIVHWTVGDVEVSMTSNLPLEELGKVARSVR